MPAYQPRSPEGDTMNAETRRRPSLSLSVTCTSILTTCSALKVSMLLGLTDTLTRDGGEGSSAPVTSTRPSPSGKAKNCCRGCGSQNVANQLYSSAPTQQPH